MKKLLLLALIATGILFTSCEKKSKWEKAKEELEEAGEAAEEVGEAAEESVEEAAEDIDNESGKAEKKLKKLFNK